MSNKRLYEDAALVATIDPQTLTVGATYSDYVDMSKFGRLTAIMSIGDFAAETIDFKLVGYSDESASDPTDLVAATQLAAHATNNDNDQVVLEMTADAMLRLAQAAGVTLQYVRACVTIGAGGVGGPISVVVLGSDPREWPASESDLASVVEVKRV